MKNILLGTAVFICLLSCQKKEVDPNIESNVMLEEPTIKIADSLKADQGLVLIEGADCLTCHKMDARVVGPSYQEVADKYTLTDENIDMLANKIINGGKGNWGEIPMSAHVGMSKETAKQMVKYILTMK